MPGARIVTRVWCVFDRDTWHASHADRPPTEHYVTTECGKRVHPVLNVEVAVRYPTCERCREKLDPLS